MNDNLRILQRLAGLSLVLAMVMAILAMSYLSLAGELPEPASATPDCAPDYSAQQGPRT